MKNLSEQQILGAQELFVSALKKWVGHERLKHLESVERAKIYINDHFDEIDLSLVQLLLKDRQAEPEENVKRIRFYCEAFAEHYIRTECFNESIEFVIPNENPVVAQSNVLQGFFGHNLIENNFNRNLLPPADEFKDALEQIGKRRGKKCYILLQGSLHEDKWLIDLKNRLVSDLKIAGIFAEDSLTVIRIQDITPQIAQIDKFILLATPALKKASGQFDYIFDEKLESCRSNINKALKQNPQCPAVLPVILQGNTVTAVPERLACFFTPENTVNAGAVNQDGYYYLLEKIIQHCHNQADLTLNNQSKQLS